MKLSALLPVYAVSTFAFVIPPNHSTKDAIAGSIAPVNVTEIDSALATLDVEYKRLEALKQELFDLHHKVSKQEKDILTLINKDYASCSGFRCYVQTAIQKAPDYLTFVKTHFRHPPCSKEKPMPAEVSEDEKAKSDASIDFMTSGGSLPPQIPKPEGGNLDFGHLPHPHHPPGSPLPFDHGDHDFDFGPPEHVPPHFRPPFEHPEYDPEKPNPEPPAEKPHSGHRPHHRPHFPAHMPHPAPRHRHFRLILIAAGMTISLLIMAILFKLARVYLSNPRVQADRAARREECRTKREYRRAACQHRIRQCLSRFRRNRHDSESGDYEEKRAMLQQRGSDSESSTASHIVGSDIESLRRAHEIVDRLMRAEEGRQDQQRQRSSSFDSSSAPSSSRSVRSLQTSRTTTTLPLYAPPPPRYSTEISRDMEVVDGFRYTPSQSGVTPTSSEVAGSISSFVLNDEDLRTESSVVDCQSRMSMETGSVAPSVFDAERGRSEKSFELAGDQYNGRFN